MAPFKKKGLFPPFPFGTDFTKEELALGKGAQGVKRKKWRKVWAARHRVFGKAMTIRSVPQKAKPYLQRMQLDNPITGKEKMMQKTGYLCTCF